MSKSFKETLMKKASKKENRGVRMPEDQDQELNRLAKQSKKSVGQAVIEALRYALKVEK